MKATNKLSDCQADTAAGPGPTQEVIARLAELIWEKEGRPAGRAAEIWLHAESALRGTNEPTHDEPQP